MERVRRDQSSRDRLVENNLSEGIAFQIVATRDERGLTQARLAEKAGIANNLPRLEDPDYGKHTITTLKKLASALGVALVVRFVPFSQYIDWLSGTPYLDRGLSPEALAVPSFNTEERSGTFDLQVKHYSLINGGKRHLSETDDQNEALALHTGTDGGNDVRSSRTQNDMDYNNSVIAARGDAASGGESAWQ